jgi:hypothetical protein
MIGRIVHYVPRPEQSDRVACWAALVTEVGEVGLDRGGHLGLFVISPSGAFHLRLETNGVGYDSGRPDGPGWDLCTGYGHEGGTWHWPARD